MRLLDIEKDEESILAALLPPTDKSETIEAGVREILTGVRECGDEALAEYTRRFDWPAATIEALEVSSEELIGARQTLDPELTRVLEESAGNIRAFHKQERGHLQSWMFASELGRFLGQLLTPVRRVGIYVPGGKAAYPSTVLMCAIPARVAGVEEIVLCTPPDKDGNIPGLVAAAACGLADRVFKLGGAQAIGAMAYGTKTVPHVDVIVGPGNTYVNTAKRLVYGEVGIDMLAGPSEVAIVADETGVPSTIAADLLAQTEHGPDNRGFLFCPSEAVIKETNAQLEAQLKGLKRQDILAATRSNLVMVRTRSVREAMDLVNKLAPEHLELHVANPYELLALVKNAGAVLLGSATGPAIGDYIAGPSHTLPTAGAARFSSALSVATFMKRTSVLGYSGEAAGQASESAARFAEAEGFDAHAAAARIRL